MLSSTSAPIQRLVRLVVEVGNHAGEIVPAPLQAALFAALGDVESNLKKHLEYVERARDEGASLIVFPELSLTGYYLMDITGEVGMPLAIEPLHPMYAADRACVNTLSQALDLCVELGEGVGVAVDIYHVWWDPELEAQIARAGQMGAILAHHICDWLVPTTDLLLDRGMMGDGVVDLPAIRRMVEAAGFHGPQEVEIFSKENWWKRPGDEVLATCIERFQTVC
jgi:sugar phosphate isomerase/epimerase